jgi:hypothetical protein
VFGLPTFPTDDSDARYEVKISWKMGGRAPERVEGDGKFDKVSRISSDRNTNRSLNEELNHVQDELKEKK